MVKDPLTAQSYIVFLNGEATLRAFLFLKIHNDLELVDNLSAPAFVGTELFEETIKDKWAKQGTSELSVTNRKVFNLEFIKDSFMKHKALVLDVGHTASSIVTYHDGLFTIKEEEIGLSSGLLSLLDAPEKRKAFVHSLPDVSDEDMVLDYLAERELFPSRIPGTFREQLVDVMAGREIIHELYKKYPRQFSVTKGLKKKVLGRESDASMTGVAFLTGEVFLNHFEQPVGPAASGLAMFAFMDGADIKGIWHVYQDGQEMLSVLGRLRKEGILKAPVNQYVQQLGTIIALDHMIPHGKDLGILRFDLGYQSPQEVHVKSGDVIRLPFESGVAGKLDMVLESSVEIQGLNAEAAGDLEIIGGTVGIIIDARSQSDIIQRLSQDQLRHLLQQLGINIS